MTNKKTTIKDVAIRANVSIATVSNALNNVDIVRPETRAKVVQAAKELNYVPNLMGRQLRSGQTKMLGLFTDSVTGPYFYTLVEAISHEVDRAGYGMHVITTSDHKVMMNSILGGLVDGAIIFEHSIDTEEIQQIKDHALPTILIDRVDSGKKMSSITFDSVQEGYEVAKHLINLGHKKICFVSGQENSWDNSMRFKGIQQAFKEFNLNLDDLLILQGMFEEGISYNVVKSYLHRSRSGEERVTAFIAVNDLSALGVIKAIQDAGYTVPGTFSVTGFDDIDIAEFFHPSITTVRNPIARQGVLAVHQLLDMINGADGEQEEFLKGKLIIRNSTGVVRNTMR